MGLKDIRTGDTLCAEDNPIILETHELPGAGDLASPIEPKTKADQDKLGAGAGQAGEEDPTFRVHTDEETGQTIISGMGELHLEIIVDRMKREFKVEANVGKPQVAYNETIRKEVKATAKFVRRPAAAASSATCWLEIEPQRPGRARVRRTPSWAVDPQGIHPRRRQGYPEAPQTVCSAGYPVVDVKVDPG